MIKLSDDQFADIRELLTVTGEPVTTETPVGTLIMKKSGERLGRLGEPMCKKNGDFDKWIAEVDELLAEMKGGDTR